MGITHKCASCGADTVFTLCKECGVLYRHCPCKDCKKRTPKCHSSCVKYNKWRLIVRAAHEYEAEEKRRG